jgi:multidrug efflux system outer membrane protein
MRNSKRLRTRSFYDLKQTVSSFQKSVQILSKSALTVLFFLTGCSAGPNYEPPQILMPEEYQTPLSLSSEETSHLKSWWTQFEDPKLNVLIHETLRQNLELQIAVEKIYQVRAEYQIQAAELAPKVDAVAEERRSRISQTLFDSTLLGPPFQNFYRIGFDASWEIDLFGKRRREKEKAFYTYQAQREEARDIYLCLLSEVARTYIEICALEKQIHIKKEQIFIQEELLRLTKALEEAGLSSEVESQRADAMLEEMRASLPPIEASLNTRIYGLAVLLGKPPEVFTKTFEYEGTIPFSSQDIPLGLPSDLLRRRPDIRKAERALAAATANVGSAIADLFPRFSLIGDFGFQSNRSNHLFKAQSRTFSFGPSIDWPIFYFGRIRENIRAQTSFQKQVLLSYENTILTALEDVENSLTFYYREKEKRALVEKEVKAKFRLYELQKDLYLSGLSDFQTFLEANQALLDVENTLIISTQTLSTHLVGVYKALGGEW